MSAASRTLVTGTAQEGKRQQNVHFGNKHRNYSVNLLSGAVQLVR